MNNAAERARWLSAIPATDAARFRSKVAVGDGCWLWTGARFAGGYGGFSTRFGFIGAHRVAFALAGNVVPAGKVLDHICMNKACVNPAHLRIASPQQNGCYKPPTRGSSRYKGVSWHRRGGRWQASIRIDRRSYGLGLFDTEEQAARAYNAAAREAFGEFAYLNTLQEAA